MFNLQSPSIYKQNGDGIFSAAISGEDDKLEISEGQDSGQQDHEVKEVDRVEKEQSALIDLG